MCAVGKQRAETLQIKVRFLQALVKVAKIFHPRMSEADFNAIRSTAERHFNPKHTGRRWRKRERITSRRS